MARDPTDIFSSTHGMGHFVSPSKKMIRAYFWPKPPYTSCFLPDQMVDENKSVGITKIGNFDTLQMIHAGIPHR